MSSSHRSFRRRLKHYIKHGKQPTETENPRAVPQPPETDPPAIDPVEIEASQAGQLSSDKTPIWTQSMKRFEKEKPQLYKDMKTQIKKIQDLDVDNWDTWKPEESRHAWFRRCKAYLPDLKSIKSVALDLSNLDPHKIAPWVTAGVFLAAELCFDSVDPSTRDKAVSTILKANIIVGKWVDGEPDLRRMKNRSRSSDIENIEQKLEKMYFDSLVLISSIYASGKTRGSRAASSLISGPAEWDRDYQKLSDQNSVCSELKSRVESELKRHEANVAVLDWIRDRSKDPEPAHQTVRERTGIDDSTSMAGKWFLETEEFSTWIDQIRRNEADKSTFWLKGPMGTGKTTLMCRVVSHFEESPISGVRFVHYYCFGSQIATESKAPTYESMLRALCYRLAWNSDGSVAEPATRLYDQYKAARDVVPTEKNTWEPLLRDLISSAKPIVFVIDALDECKSKDDSKRLLAFLSNLRQNSSGPYLLVSSRPHINVKGHFEDSIQIFNCVQPQTGEDMTRFIKIENDELCKRLESALSNSAGGMFRWVQIWLGIFFPKNKTAIRRSGYAKELLDDLENLESLGKLSEGEDDEFLDKDKRMEEAYRRLWNTTDAQYKKYQIRLFHVVIGSLEKLSLQQLLEAVSFDPDNPNDYEELQFDELEGLYCNFLKQDSEGYFDFEHISAKVFLAEMKKEGSGKPIFSETECNYTLANITINALERPNHQIWTAAGITLIDWGRQVMEESGSASFPEELQEKVRDAIDSDHYGDYIFRYGFTHCGFACNCSQSFQRKMSELFRSARSILGVWAFFPEVPDCIEFYQALTRSTSQGKEAICVSPLLCTVGFNISPFSHDVGSEPALLPGFDDIIIQNLDKQTPLHIACKMGNYAIVEDLLKFERSKRGTCYPLLVAKDRLGRIPMHEASSDGAVETLLEYEILESQSPPAEDGFRTSRLLDSENENGMTALLRIIQKCSDDFVGQILAEYHLSSQSLDELIREATNVRKKKILECLIKGKGIINGKTPSRTIKNLPALHSAARSGDLEMIDLLLHWGAGIHTVGNLYGPVICAATASGDTKVVEYLIDRGANINDVGGTYGSALGIAAQGNLRMANFLLERGADINAQGGKYKTPLAIAARSYSSEMVVLLMEKGADVGLLSEETRARAETNPYLSEEAKSKLRIGHVS
ncbi:hypothetical protein F4818DRAFT_446510 [Hypoxylon cercidicola]|nr:hypothetical protein F4818DRAFT_446510 [Hypoxylon cercidicola]